MRTLPLAAVLALLPPCVPVSAKVHTERERFARLAVPSKKSDAAPSLHHAKSVRQRRRLTPSQRSKCEGLSTVGNHAFFERDLLAKLSHRGGGRGGGGTAEGGGGGGEAGGGGGGGGIRQWAKSKGAVPATATKFAGKLTAVQRDAAINLVGWAAINSATLAWSRSQLEGSDKGMVQKAFAGAVVVSSSAQVLSNVLRAISRPGANRESQKAALLAGLGKFRWSYLGVLAACNFGEFVQGAYIFHVYDKNKGFGMTRIANMILVGTISSMVTGTFAGSFLDRYGRRNGCMLWALLNAAQCLLIRSKMLGALILGRIMAGAGATLLATAFESWMVTEHHSRGYPSHSLADTFRMATWGIGVATVASGFAGDAAVKRTGLLGPFNVAAGVSLVAFLLIARLWKENYGDRSFSAFHHTREAFWRIAGDGRLLMMGLVQVLFEGSMMTWVVLWVPVFQNALQGKNFRTGTVFSTLMVSMCGGSSFFKLLTEALPERLAFSPEACVVLASGVATVALAVASMDLSPAMLLLMFLVYETCIGLYFPAMATCRSDYIDDRLRGTVTNMLRVPTHLVVALMMAGPVGDQSLTMDDRVVLVFGILAGLTGVATLVQVLLLQRMGEVKAEALWGQGARAGWKEGGSRTPANSGGREAPSVKQPQTEPVVAAGAWSLFPRPESPPRDSPIARGGEKTQVKGVDGGQQGSMVAIKTRADAASRPSENRSTLNRHPSMSKAFKRKMASTGSGKATTDAATVIVAGTSRADKRDADSATNKMGDVNSSIAKKGEQEDTALPSRSRAAVREASSRGTELKTRQPDGVFPPVERRKAVNVRLSKSHLPKSSPGKAEAASSNAAQSKAEQSKTLEEIRRRSKAVGAATSTTRGKEGKGKLTAFVSSLAGGVAATGFFLYRIGILRGSQSPQDQSASWNPFNDVHATGRHPSWSSKWGQNDRSSSTDGKTDEAQASSVCAEEKQAGSKQGTADSAAQDGAKGGGTSAVGAEKGEIKREWPVFGSGGVGGRFGAY